MLILALDPPLGVDVRKWLQFFIENLGDIVDGFKIGLPAILRIDRRDLREILSITTQNHLVIADLKFADIGDIMVLSLEALKELGFNAVIAHSFVGYEDALDKLSDRCRELGIKLISVVSMSHRGASEVMDLNLDRLVEISLKARVWGVVAPATRPHIIQNVRSIVGKEIKILSPGIGVQGASPGDALCAGADYEIVGRLITRSYNPRETALEVKKQQMERLRVCRG